jgi:hypothetical protein
LTSIMSNVRIATNALFRFDESYNPPMPVNVIKARLNSLRKNLPTGDVEQSVVNDFNAIVDELEEELPDPKISHFKVSAADVKPLFIQRIPGEGAKHTSDKYCDNRVRSSAGVSFATIYSARENLHIRRECFI